MKVRISGPKGLANREFKHWALSKSYTLENEVTEMSAEDYKMLIATHGTTGISPKATPEELAAARTALNNKLAKAAKKKK